MDRLHSLMLRQLKRQGLVLEQLPPALQQLIEMVSDAYTQFDADRRMMERSLDLSSQELLQANYEMRALLQTFPDLFFWLDGQGVILDVKGSSPEAFQLPPHRLVGKKIQDIPDRQIGDRFVNALLQVKESRGMVQFEYQLHLRGSLKHFEARMLPLLKDQAIAVVRDITERKAAENELYHSRQMLQLVLDNIPQRVFWKNADCVFLGCNLPCALDAGLSEPEEIVGKYDAELSWSANAETYRANDLAVLRSGKAMLSCEEPLDRPEKPRRWLRTNRIPLRDRHGQIFGLLGTYEDISEDKWAKEALRDSEERYRMTAEATGQAIYDWDIRSGIVRWAGAITAITGYSPEEFQHVGYEQWEALIHPEDHESTIASVETAQHAGIGYNAAYRFRRRDGSYVHVEDTGAFLRNEAGEAVRLIGAMKDVSAQIQSQKEKERVEEQLRQAQKMEAVGRLAGGVAHDFNNILTAIIGHVQLLMTSLHRADPALADLQEIKKAADRAASLTSQLLAFSRKQIIDPRVIDLNALVPQCVRMIERLIGEDVVVEFRPAAQLWSINADPGQLEQILVNLSVNARDAMPKGGRVVIATQNTQVGEDLCSRTADATPGEYVRLQVSDSGSGISPETLEHLFEPFFTTKSKGKGTGLGLSMVYGIVRQNQGFILVDSEAGEGTTFSVYLPRTKAAPQLLRPPPASSLPGGKETILLVEDEDMVRRLTARLLTRQGYLVVAASSAGEALSLCATLTNPIDLLVTDVVMPNMNGRELFDKLRETMPTLKVLFTSGYPEDIIAHHGVLFKGTQFLAKPFSIESLLHRIRELLDSIEEQF